MTGHGHRRKRKEPDTLPRHSETRQLPYQAAQMYALVADVARYPEFLPWCAATRIRGREERGDHEVMDTDMVISFKVFREKFGTRVTLWPGEQRIETEYLEGPFRHLKSEWRFTSMDAGCQVDFWVDFEFKSRLLQGVIGLVFNEAMQRIVRAFEARAAQLFGPG
jgi:coenzyme Q-binding protein COQ10